MNLDQIAGELRQMPDTALQQQAKAPGAVPGYLVADEIQRRIQARKAPPQQGNDQGKPTILSILANNLAPPQTPISKPMAQVPFSPVPSNNLMTQPTMPQHLDDGGTVKSFDPSTLYSDVPVGPGSGSAGDVQTNDLATAAPPSAMPPTPVWNPPTSAATPDEAQPPVSSYPQTSTSPIQDPPNTHKGGRSFLETLTALAPAMQYLGNIGAGAGRAGGNFATGVGYANEQQQAQMQLDQARKDKQAELAQEMALKQGQMGMESQKMQMEGLMGGAKFVGPDGKVQEAPVNAPSANINGVPMGGGQIAGSGAVPSNPQMTQMTGLQGYGGRQMDYSDILTPQKQQQLAVQNREAEQANQAGLEVAKAKALWINLPKELAGSGFSEGQLVPPSVVEARLKEVNPALETHWTTNNQGDETLMIRNPVSGDIKQQVFKGVGPNKDEMTAVQQSQADHRDAVLAAAIARAGASQESKGTQYLFAPTDPNDPNSPRVLTAVKPGQQAPTGALNASGYNTMNMPTATTRTMAETAPKVIDLANKVEAQVDAQAKSLGPLASRWQEYMAGTVGAPNADFTKLRTDTALLQTALMRMHVGARGGEQMMKHFQDLIDVAKQDPSNLKAALGEIRSYAQEVGGTVPNRGGGAPQQDVIPVGRIRTDNATGAKDRWDGTKWVPQ